MERHWNLYGKMESKFLQYEWSGVKKRCLIKMGKLIQVVIHTHPPFVMGLVSAEIQIEPMFPHFVTYLGGRVPLLKYTIIAEQELAREIGRVIMDYNMVFLKNHGALPVGATLKEAFYHKY